MKKTAFPLFLGLSLAFSSLLEAQNQEESKALKLSGYLETYYVYDFGQPNNHNRPEFLYSFARHNEVNLNFGFIQAEYDDEEIRGKLALMTGTYANANLSAEPGVLRNIFEANAGFKISQHHNLWIDAGIFSSHIGFESAIGANCWNMTRSILAENSPYYLSGAKISYTSDNEAWFLSALLLNGWQRIQRVEGNQIPAFGHQVTWTPNNKLTLNSSSFVGSDTPDSLRQMRYFHNFYAQLQISEQFGLIAGFDIGAQQKTAGNSGYHSWYSPVLIARYSPGSGMILAARAEYYSDEGEVIISTGSPNGFQSLGYSLNVDIQLKENLLWRVEARSFNSRQDEIFFDNNQNPTRNNYFVGTSLSITIN